MAGVVISNFVPFDYTTRLSVSFVNVSPYVCTRSPQMHVYHKIDLFQMFDWICHNRDVFLMNYVEIGHSYQVAKELQEEHNHFTMSSRVSSQ